MKEIMKKTLCEGLPRLGLELPEQRQPERL